MSAYEKNKAGFTLIELLVIISIIGLLSSIIFASLSTARKNARDTRRKQDLNQIRTALNLYYDKYGNWMETGSGCGWNYNGQGWFNYQGGIYYKSMAQCLIDNGFTPAAIIDPTGGKSSTPTARYTYMKYHCGTPTSAVYLYAKLETLPQSTTALDGTCCPTCDSLFGMNYKVRIL